LKKALHYYHCALRANNVRTTKAQNVEQNLAALRTRLATLEAAAAAVPDDE
jgi:hypothetical protein